jgi:hypothetical protein
LRFDVHQCLPSVVLRAAHPDLVEITIVSNTTPTQNIPKAGNNNSGQRLGKEKHINYCSPDTLVQVEALQYILVILHSIIHSLSPGLVHSFSPLI